MSSDILGPLMRALVGVPEKMLGLVLGIVNRLSSADGECFYTDLASFVGQWKKQGAAKVTEAAKEVKVYLKHLGTVPLGATDGTVTEEQARRVFPGYLDPVFLSWRSKATPGMNAAIDELVENGKFHEFLGNTAAPLERLRWQWTQVVRFCDDHPDKLTPGGFATFFILTTDGEPVAEDLSNVFVAGVGVHDVGGLGAGLSSFSGDFIWHAESQHRLVSPQLA